MKKQTKKLLKFSKYRLQKAKAFIFRHRTHPGLLRFLIVLSVLLIGVVIFRYAIIAVRLLEIEVYILKVLSTIALSIIILSGLISYFEYRGIGPQEGIVRRGPCLPYVALTFDDGPGAEYTPMILDILKEKNVKATFFLVGKHVEKYPDIAKRIVAEGHEVGNHTYSHKEMFPASRKRVIKEIVKCEEAIEKVTGVRPVLFRPPRGIYSDAVRKIVLEMGYTMILWSISAVDWAGTPARAIAARVKRYVKPGAIILFHDNGALLKSEGHSRMNTVKALPKIIDDLRTKGYQFVTVSQLLSLEEESLEEQEKGKEVSISESGA